MDTAWLTREKRKWQDKFKVVLKKIVLQVQCTVLHESNECLICWVASQMESLRKKCLQPFRTVTERQERSQNHTPRSHSCAGESNQQAFSEHLGAWDSVSTDRESKGELDSVMSSGNLCSSRGMSLRHRRADSAVWEHKTRIRYLVYRTCVIEIHSPFWKEMRMDDR